MKHQDNGKPKKKRKFTSNVIDIKKQNNVIIKTLQEFVRVYDKFIKVYEKNESRMDDIVKEIQDGKKQLIIMNIVFVIIIFIVILLVGVFL